MEQNTVLLITVAFLALVTAVRIMFQAHTLARETKLSQEVRRLAKSRNQNIRTFRQDCADIGLIYNTDDGYPVKISEKLMNFVKKERLQYELGSIIGILLSYHEINGDAGKIAILLETEALLSKNQKSFWLGVECTNPGLFNWHSRLRQLYRWNRFA